MQQPARGRRRLARVGGLLWLFGYLALAFYWTAPVAQAQTCQAGTNCSSTPSNGVKLSAEAGLGGYARAGSWLPVYLTVENSGPTLKGQLVISVVPRAATASNPNYSAVAPLETYTSLYVQPLEIASQGRKQVTIYVPLATADAFNQRLTVELRGQAGGSPSTLLATTTVSPTPLTNQVLIGVLSNDPSRFQLYDRLAISAISSRTPLHLALAGLDSAHLPDNAQALGSLNALLVSGFDLDTLSSDQRTALANWVENGGTLLISGGAGSAALLKGLPASLRPVELPASQAGGPLSPQDQAILERLGGAALPSNSAGSSFLTRLKPVASATVRLAGTNSPLVVAMPHGNGNVVITAFDLAEARFTGWNGSSRLWETLLGPAQLSGMPVSNFYNSYGLNSNVLAGGVSNVLTNIPGISLPSLKLLALLAFLYIAIVGPLNYFVLKRLGRRELSWITLPLLTLLFTGGIYLVALRDKGSDVITSSVNIVRLSSQEGQTGPIEKSALAMVGVFTPNNNQYSLGLPANSLVSAVPNYLPSYMPPAAAGQTAYPPPVGIQIVQGPRPQVDLLGMNQWSFRSVVVEGTVRLAGGISTDLAQRDGHIQGTITNKTGRRLSDLLVVANFGEYRLAKGLNPGETTSVDFANIFGQTKGPANYKGSANIAPFIGYYQGQGSTLPEQRSDTRKRDLLNLIFSSLPGSNQSAYAGAGVSAATYPVAVIGWLDESMLPYTVNDRQIGGNDLTMLIAEAELNPARSNELWPGQVRGQVIDKQETPITPPVSTGTAQPTPARPPLPAGGASLEIGQLTVEYNMPQLAGRSLRQLTLESPGFVYRRNPYGPPVAPRYSVEVYNFRLASWVAVPGWLAPTPCLLDLSAYQGGVITAPLASFDPSLARPNLSDTCQAAMKGSITSLPPPATARLTATPATRAGSTTTVPARPTSTPPLVPVYASGPPDNFVVLENGPGFKLADFVSPTGQLRARFSRDAHSTDVMYWYYFTAGYLLN